MESMNKFKVLTIIIICLFIFAVAAMYINAKDASEGKTQISQNDSYQQKGNKEKFDFTDLVYAVEELRQRVDELETKSTSGGGSRNSRNSKDLNCKIYGSKTIRGIEPLSPTAAVQDAQVNGNEIVITCSL